MRLPPLLLALRPNQWTKNAVVAAALVFASGDRSLVLPDHAFLHTLLAVFLFCLASSTVYLINDVRDYELDRQHPTKRFRPIAAGQVSRRFAAGLAAVLLLLVPAASLTLQFRFGLVVVGYLAMQVGYTFGLKHVPFVDVLLIAAGFVLRALAGAYAIEVPISRWLLVCTFLLALFLALSKRRHEKVVLHALKDEARPSLRGYSEQTLDNLILLVCGATFTAYTFYTLSDDAANKFGDRRLLATLPFVAFGIYRYWCLVYREEGGGRPEKVLLTDPPTLVNLLLYGLTLLLLFQL